ncbi:MAG: hypothetical protein GY948_05965 [Alphaproteobacteria bacterium]|nr:hypothetical protein [Alphaproteobacteria bacterium]
MAARTTDAQNKPKSDHAGFAPLPELPSVFAVRRNNLSMFALQLNTGEVCVVSPVKGLAEQVRASLSELGPVGFLFAPNHYHNLGLEEYSHAYPEAKLIAPTGAIPRLKEVTGLSFAGPDDLALALPENTTLLDTVGLKTGESWVRVQTNGSTAWIVADAFCGPDLYGGTDGPELLKPFPKFGLGDKDQYLPWLERQLTQDLPDTLIPCHGNAVQSPSLCEQVLNLVKERL